MRRTRLVLVAILFALGLVTTARAKPPSWDTVISTGSARFKVLKAFNNEAVLDKETGLVWETTPSSLARLWTVALDVCALRIVGGRKGWRLPAVEELMSLIDPAQTGPALPQGHPFQGVQNVNYWSGNTVAFDAQYGMSVDLGSGALIAKVKTEPHLVWCVRGGQLGSDVR